jgi:hypothetical protein
LQTSPIVDQLNSPSISASTVLTQTRDDARSWKGKTLVVDTTTFTDTTRFPVDHPMACIEPWTTQIPMAKTKGPVFEYACHKGKYAMVDILAGTRAAEK